MSRSCQSRSCCLLDVLEIVIDSVMDPTFHMTVSHKGDKMFDSKLSLFHFVFGILHSLHTGFANQSSPFKHSLSSSAVMCGTEFVTFFFFLETHTQLQCLLGFFNAMPPEVPLQLHWTCSDQLASGNHIHLQHQVCRWLQHQVMCAPCCASFVSIPIPQVFQ